MAKRTGEAKYTKQAALEGVTLHRNGSSEGERAAHGLHSSIEELRRADDNALMETFQRGNEKAFGVLYERYRNDVYRFAMKMVKYNEDLASDAFQDIFVKVYEKAGTFQGTGSVKSWLMMITRNVCLNMLRTEQRQTPMGDYDEVPTPDRSLEPEHISERNALREAIECAIDELPQDLREVIVLREVDGYSYEEIANQIDSNIGVVRQRIWRARQKLRKQLKRFMEPDNTVVISK